MPKPEHSSEAHQERARDYDDVRERKKAERTEQFAKLEKLLREGLSESTIAERLGVSARQVRKLKRHLREAGSNGSSKPA